MGAVGGLGGPRGGPECEKELNIVALLNVALIPGISPGVGGRGGRGPVALGGPGIGGRGPRCDKKKGEIECGMVTYIIPGGPGGPDGF